MSCRSLRRTIVALAVGLGLVAASPAAEAQVCIHPGAPSPLEICVQDSGTPGVWLDQSGARVNQYYGGFSWHSLLALAGTDQAQMFSTGLTEQQLTLVSNTLSGSGTAGDPFVITTVLAAGTTGVQLEQTFTYVTGDRYFRKRWTVRHTGTDTFSDVRFFHGGDTFFGGDDRARSWWNPASRMVYVNNDGFDTTGYMGFYASPVTPSAAFFGGHYGQVYQLMQAGQFNDTADPSFLDAGYGLQWNRATLAPGQTWVIEGFETWSAPGSLQVLPPSDDAAASGSTVRRRFGIHNLHPSAASGAVAITAELIGAPQGWSATIVGGSTVASLDPLTSSYVDVDITIPQGAAPGAAYEVRLTADPEADGVPNGVAAFKLSVLSNDISITPDPLVFGNVLTDTTVTRTITIANAPTGTPLRLGGIGETNPVASPFSIVGDTCSFNPVAPGASCTITLAFSPTSGAAVDETFDIAILEPTASLLTVAVNGNRQVGGTFTVTPSASAGGSISPATPQVVAAGASAAFTVAPAAGYQVASVTGCSGSLAGDTYTIASVNTDCTVRASFYRAPVTLTRSGSEQSTLLFNLFPQALAVTVRDADDAPVPNATVTFAPPASGASAVLSATTVVTDTQGRAAVSASANNVAGTYQVSATALGVVTLFDLTNVIRPASQTVVEGTPQSTAICTAFPTPLRVRVLDASTPELPVANVPVTFSAPGTGPSASLSATTVVTDSNGEAAITATANSTPGSYTVTANVPGIAPASFVLTNDPGTPCDPPTVPTDVTATPGDGQATVTWDAPDSDGGVAITGYQVTVSPAPAGGSATRTVAGNVTTLVFTNLQNGTPYTFTVRAVNSVGTGPVSAPSNPVTPGVVTSVPGAPTSVTAMGGSEQATVSWTAPTDNGGAAITGYSVQMATAPGGPFTSTSCPTNSTFTSCTVTGLTNGVTYYFRVAAINAQGTGAYSPVSNGVTPTVIVPTIPGAPGVPTAVALSRSALVRVTPPTAGTAPTSYTITAYVEGSNEPAGTCTVTGAAGSCTVTGLTNGTRYVFRVVAHNATGSSAPSEPSAPVTPLAAGPTRLTVISVIGNRVTLIWEPAAEGAADGYEALVGPAPGTVTAVTPLRIAADTDIYTTEVPSGVYYMRLRGRDGQATTDVSNEVRVVVGPHVVPSAPADVRTTVNGSTLTLGWRPTFDGTAPTGMRVIARRNGAVVGQGDFGFVDNVTIPGVPTGEYDLSVAAIYQNTTGPESASTTVSVPGSGCEVPGTPTRLRVVVSRVGRVVSALWQPPVEGGAATSYQVLVEGAITGAFNVPQRQLASTAPPGTYHLRVVARNACGVSAPSEVRTVTVQ